MKICSSALNVILVPVCCVDPCGATGPFGIPRSYSCTHTLPSRRTSSRHHSLSALTTDTPTPWSPPETL